MKDDRGGKFSRLVRTVDFDKTFHELVIDVVRQLRWSRIEGDGGRRDESCSRVCLQIAIASNTQAVKLIPEYKIQIIVHSMYIPSATDNQ